MRSLRGALGDALAVIINGLRLVARHAPTLLVIYLFGSTVRNGVLWASVEVSAHNSTLAGFMLPLAPMATLDRDHPDAAGRVEVPLVSVVRRTRPAPTPRRRRGSVSSRAPSIPFLTVYAAQGYLKEDIRLFVNEASYDEIYGTAGSFYGHAADSGPYDHRRRHPAGRDIVVVALVLRFAIDKLDLPSKHTTWGLLAAYVEVLWLFLIAAAGHEVPGPRVGVGDRPTVRRAGSRTAWATLTDAVGPIGDPLRSTAHWARQRHRRRRRDRRHPDRAG